MKSKVSQLTDFTSNTSIKKFRDFLFGLNRKWRSSVYLHWCLYLNKGKHFVILEIPKLQEQETRFWGNWKPQVTLKRWNPNKQWKPCTPDLIVSNKKSIQVKEILNLPTYLNDHLIWQKIVVLLCAQVVLQ